VFQILPKVVVEWYTLPLHTREAPCSNHSPETNYPDWNCSWFFQSIQANVCILATLKSGHNCFLPNPFQFIIHLSSFHLTLYSMRYFKVSTNKLQTNNIWCIVQVMKTSLCVFLEVHFRLSLGSKYVLIILFTTILNWRLFLILQTKIHAYIIHQTSCI
jgi:hypothetical protein